MKKLFIITIFLSFVSSCALFAKSNDANWFLGIGATITGDSSAMVPTASSSSLYREKTYDTDIGDGIDQLSLHIGYLWDIYSGFEVSYSQMAFNSSGDKEGSLTLTELDWLIGFEDWNIGFTNQEIDLIVPFMKIGMGMASWSDEDTTSNEDISGTVGKVGVGILLHFGPNIWGDLSYNIRSIGFLGTSAAEQSPLQTANFAIKAFF